MIFFWFFYGFRGESLTSWPELIGVINGEYTSWYPCYESAWGSRHTYTVLHTTPSRVTVVLLLWGRNRLRAALKIWRSFPPEPWKHQYLLTGPIPKKVRLETSSSTRCSHTSTTRTQSPFPKSTPLYSSYLWVTNLNFFSTQLLVPGTIPNFSSQRCPRQKCPGHICLFSFGDQSSRVWPYPHLSGLTFSSSLATISATLTSRSRIPDDVVRVNWSSVQKICEISPSVGHLCNVWSRPARVSKDQESCCLFLFQSPYGFPDHHWRPPWDRVCWSTPLARPLTEHSPHYTSTKSTQLDQDGYEARTRPCLCESSVDRGETRVSRSDGFARELSPGRSLSDPIHQSLYVCHDWLIGVFIGTQTFSVPTRSC